MKQSRILTTLDRKASVMYTQHRFALANSRFWTERGQTATAKKSRAAPPRTVRCGNGKRAVAATSAVQPARRGTIWAVHFGPLRLEDEGSSFKQATNPSFHAHLAKSVRLTKKND